MNEKKELLLIGEYQPETAEHEEIIHRSYYRQGYIFKDEDAFLHHPDRVCYVPELSDATYTRQDFLTLCNGQEDFAAECFYGVDWQHPDTWVEEQYREEEWGWCPRCEQIYDMAGVSGCPCPKCGYNPVEGEEVADTESERRPAESGGL